jgi:hypothetical protein
LHEIRRAVDHGYSAIYVPFSHHGGIYSCSLPALEALTVTEREACLEEIHPAGEVLLDNAFVLIDGYYLVATLVGSKFDSSSLRACVRNAFRGLKLLQGEESKSRW